MKLMILGASNAQCNAIQKAKDKGIRVLASDYNTHAPGKDIADELGLASTFDVEESFNLAKERQVDGVMTTGTDQPVYVVSSISEKMGLPHFIDSKVAYTVTNKIAMKQKFMKCNLPTVDFVFIKEGFKDSDLVNLKPPYVLKPVDSQGQRGIYKLNTLDEVRRYLPKTLSYSREEVALLESYYPNDEITVSGWVRQGKTHVLTITDRITFKDSLHIGICSSHEFPSKHYKEYGEEIIELTESIVQAFDIQEGPIYFQLFVGSQGIKINEIACRIGGAYEDEFIPYITGVDILDMVINYSLGETVDYSSLEVYDIRKNTGYFTSQLFFANAGNIEYLTSKDEMMTCEGVFGFGLNYKVGDSIPERENATARAGYMLISGDNEQELCNRIQGAYNQLKILDDKANNLCIQGKRGVIDEESS